MDSASDSTMLEKELKPAIRNRRRGLSSKGVIHLHDNPRPYVATATVGTIQRLRFQTLQQPPHSPDLAASDYHVFRSLKDASEDNRGRGLEVITRSKKRCVSG